MKFKFDKKSLTVVKKEVSTHFVVNSLSKFAVSGHSDKTAAEDNAADRNERAKALDLDVRYSVEELVDGEAIEA
ncbi:hypothetical protein DRQ25_17205 [Candidatus Fermentibacteria bacterium]|nr:MAG: hypothetical protein DRQ25_17205 [Candidatus Fermentibacteria bacterium]